MKTIKASLFLAFLIVFATVRPAFSAPNPDTEDTRYFIQNTRTFWKGTLGVRHMFEDGFTTDLSDWQLKLTKLAGLKVYPVRKLNILLPSPVPSLLGNGELIGPVMKTSEPTPLSTPTLGGRSSDQSVGTDEGGLFDTLSNKIRRLISARPVPSSQVSWGMHMIYNNPILTKTSGGLGIKVAVLDTGVQRDHPDLQNRIGGCKDFTQAKSPVVQNSCDDGNGHGTHVAGIIAADGGSDHLGVYGVAPDATLLIYKVCSNNGSCWSDDIASAIREATDDGAQVMNFSFGTDAPSSLVLDAVNYADSKGALIVAAAGNDGPYAQSVDYPAALADVIAVGAVDSGRNVPDWSSRGANASTVPGLIETGDLEFVAPGVNVESTWKDGGYVILSGTSMASPHVAGLAAKLWDNTLDQPAQAVRKLLHSMASDIAPIGEDEASGFGIPSL